MHKINKSPGRAASFRFAIKGIRQVFLFEPNFRIHLTAAVIAVVAGAWFRITNAEWGIVILAITAVLTAETFNTALELLTDLVSPEFNPLAGKIKDISAAAVLITSLGAVFAGAFVFLPRIISFPAFQA